MIRILLVEDEPQIQSLMEKILTTQDYGVLAVGTVQDAIAQEGPFDLLLLDRILPNGDGKRVAQHFEGVPTLYVTGGPEADLRKPFTRQELLEKVAERIGR